MTGVAGMFEAARPSPGGPTAPGGGTPEGSAAAISSDFETFLQMLTVQLENQDPLNPVDSTDYAVQLATFSSVEQQVQTNDLMRTLISRITTTGLAEMAGWVGMEVRAAAPAQYDGSTPLELLTGVATTAERAELTVRNASGAEVRRLGLPPGAETFPWDGTLGEGPALPAGPYTFEVTTYAQGRAVATRPVEVYQAVREVRAGAEGPSVILASGAEIPASEVTALRAPQPSGAG